MLVLDDLSTGRLENVEHLLESDRFEFVEGSMLDAEVVDECLADVDRVLHLASAVGVKLIVAEPLNSLLRNVRGNDIVMSAAAKRKRFLLFTSTSEVYGKNGAGPLSEGADRLLGPTHSPRWAYANAKAFGEALAHHYHREQGTPTVVTRLFNTVGPRQTGAYGMVLPRFVEQALAGDDLTVYGNGTQTRCFCHVQDTVAALLAVLDCDEAVGQTLNVGASEEIPVVELARRVIERVDSPSTIRLVPYEEAYGDDFEEMLRRQPDTSALRELTGWRPRRTVDDAIDEVAARATARLAAPVARPARNGVR